MTSCFETFTVHNHETNEVCQIDFVDGLSDNHLEFVTKEWTPILRDRWERASLTYHALPSKKQSERTWQEKQRKFGAPDSHWNWYEKNQSMQGSVHRIFALLNCEVVEALMRVDLSTPSQIQHATRTPIVYVEYLAVAPWNRPAIQSRPRFKGFGTLLLGAAVSLSFEEGMDGRCGLHSLTQSEGFYIHAGMENLGVDKTCGLKYFEFSPDAARKFLEP